MSQFLNENTLFILDSYGLIYREYFAFISRPLTNSKKENISAVFGFFRNLATILKTYKPQFMVAAMDSKTPTFRHEMYPEYKATRQKTPEELKAQFPWIEDLLGILGIPVVRCNGFEADDVIATLAKKAEQEGRNCAIFSADKDLMQLASDSIHIMKPDKTEIWKEIDENGVIAEWGVPPASLLDLLSLIGDTADNVPGVKGVGEKTALKLLTQYNTLEGIYENADSIKGAIGEKIRADKDNAFFSKKLIELRYDVPCVQDISSFNTSSLNYREAAKALADFEIPAVAKQYESIGQYESSSAGTGTNTSAPAQKSQELDLFGSLSSAEQQEQKVQFSEPLKNKGNYSAATKIEELAAFIDSILAKGEISVAFDTETNGLNTRNANLVGFSLAFEKGKGIYVPLILTDSLLAGTLISKKEAFDQLKRLFVSDKKLAIIMHNAKFDMQILECNGFINHSEWTASIYDTMIAAWLLEPDRSGKNAYSLEYLAETKLGLKGTEFDEIVPKNGTFADVPLEVAANYGAEDSDFTLQLWVYEEPILKKEGLYDLFITMEMKVLPILSDMELTGIHISAEQLHTYSVELKNKLSGIEKDIYETVGHEFNIASPKQLGQVLFEERGLKGTKKTKTGYSTNEEVLEALSSQDPVPRMILDYRTNAKLLSTYVETLPTMADSNGRVHTTFIQTGTATGRLSSRDPNLQNIPVRDEAGRKIRTAFTAAPGTVLISADYAQIELVVMAHLSGDKNLCKAFNEGIDVHKSTAALIYGVPFDSVTAEQRRSAKTINFGVMYGMSAFRLANDLGISRTQAKEFIDNYFMIYSGVREFFDKNVQEAETTGFVKTIFGRKRQILAINSVNKLEKEGAVRIAKNTPIQGSAADIVKKAMISVSDALAEAKTGAKLLLQVHDELILECPDTEEAIENTIAIVREKMESAVKLNVPLRVSIEHGKSWGLFH